MLASSHLLITVLVCKLQPLPSLDAFENCKTYLNKNIPAPAKAAAPATDATTITAVFDYSSS